MNDEPKYRGWRAIQLGDIAKHLAQYQPYVATVLAVLLVTTLLPGAPASRSSQAGGLGGALQDSPANGPGPSTASPGASSTVSTPLPPGAANPTNSTPTIQGGYSSLIKRPAGCAATDPYCSALAAPDCDAKRGTIKMPMVDSLPCVPLFKGDNGGRSWQGVTRDTITVAIYIPKTDQQAASALSAAGVSDTDAQIEQMYRDWIALLQGHVEMYGRKVKPVFVHARSAVTDIPAARADAIEIATKVKPFAVLMTAAPLAFGEELAARQIMVFPYYAWRADTHVKWSPFMWGPASMGASELMYHTSEYIGKRLWGRPAKNAGDPLLASKSRTLGVLYVDSGDADDEKALDQMSSKWLGRYGARIKTKQSYVLDYSTIQTQAKTIMAKFQADGVTSIIWMADYLATAFFLQAATNQGYFPEYVITGFAFTDLNFYGRIYDQTQWSHAFGLSQAGVRIPLKRLNWVKDLYQWHFGAGKEVPAESGYAVLFQEVRLLFFGIHLTGPTLTPYTFKDAVFNRLGPCCGAYQKHVVFRGRGFGATKNGVWPWDDYVYSDDMAEIWWDPQQRGEDELGNEGTGMLKFSDGGRRYLPGQYPRSDSRAFEQKDAVYFFDQYPAREKPPAYPHKHVRAEA